MRRASLVLLVTRFSITCAQTVCDKLSVMYANTTLQNITAEQQWTFMQAFTKNFIAGNMTANAYNVSVLGKFLLSLLKRHLFRIQLSKYHTHTDPHL